ncbi:FAD-binding protein [Nesterenkonia sp. CL21]|uniref:FAD-binding protein n=1 Tax=Nesterenkonia sp. CL21 TaxID=3064894 RepID=UPI002879CD0E|nr:D-arabinono-1,4-lactone oxidase [Nesterenkonia sp. CL21]MDS2171772.1 FAD-binding protein [Nesterenkonia sp. CL21]
MSAGQEAAAGHDQDGPSTSQKASAEHNWAGNLTYQASEVAHPRSVDELHEAMTRPGRKRLLGSRHSFNTIADTTGTLICLDQMPAMLEVHEDSVTVAGGMRYGDLAPALHQQGFGLNNLASLPHISVAGAVATGTHGSGDRVGTLSSAVRSLEIMAPDGSVHTLRRGEPDFDGAVVNLGALGAVITVELDVEPTYEVAQTVFEAPRWDAVMENLDAVTGLGRSVSIFTTWSRTDVADQMWVKAPVPAQVDQAETDALVELLDARVADGKRHPLPGVSAASCSEQGGLPGPWYDRLPHFQLEFTPSAGAELQSEYLVPRQDAVEAFEAVRGLADRIRPLLQANEIRTMRGDDLWLSPAFAGDTVGFHFTWHPDQEGVTALLPALEEALPASARPHWGKLFALDATALRARFPRWEDFARLRRHFDPDGRLRNDFLASVGL